MSKRRSIHAIIAALALAGSAVAVTAAPALFGKISPGLWELSGIEGKKAPVRACIGDLSELARIEHRGARCAQHLINDSATSATFSYQCSATEFGRSKLTFVTARNVRVETQGISGGLPFSYVVQARRLGDCQQKALPGSH